jgi:hypothetical protein
MRRIVLGIFGATIMLGPESASCVEHVPLNSRAGFDAISAVEPVVCWPFPPWYPLSWELVVHTSCPPGYYLPDYHHYADLVLSHRDSRLTRFRHRPAYVLGSIHRRPYLRPGWWW